MTQLPQTRWQPDTTGMVECTHHDGQCAYHAGDRTRCDRCHRPWERIIPEGIEAHIAWHNKRDATRRADSARYATAKARAALAGTPQRG